MKLYSGLTVDGYPSGVRVVIPDDVSVKKKDLILVFRKREHENSTLAIVEVGSEKVGDLANPDNYTFVQKLDRELINHLEEVEEVRRMMSRVTPVFSWGPSSSDPNYIVLQNFLNSGA